MGIRVVRGDRLRSSVIQNFDRPKQKNYLKTGDQLFTSCARVWSPVH